MLTVTPLPYAGYKILGNERPSCPTAAGPEALAVGDASWDLTEVTGSWWKVVEDSESKNRKLKVFVESMEVWVVRWKVPLSWTIFFVVFAELELSWKSWKMHEDKKAFCHKLWNWPESKRPGKLIFKNLENKSRDNLQDKKERKVSIYKVPLRDVWDVKSRRWRKLMQRDTKVTQH